MPTTNGSDATTTSTMKTTILRHGSVLGLLLLASTIHAANGDLPEVSMTPAQHTEMQRAVRHQIDRFVIFPLSGAAEPMFGTVDIAYVVNAEGRVVVVDSDSKNNDLRDYVVRKLGRIKVGPNPSGLWNITRLRFTFRPE